MNSNTKFSVIMNCFNGEKYLKDAIESVISQTYKDWELIFWDNKSTDKSAEIFKEYKDCRLKYFYSNQKTNLSEARRLAVNKSKGDIITFLDVDDYWDETILETQHTLYEKNDIIFTCGNFFIVKDNKAKLKTFRKKIPSGRVLKSLLTDYFVGLLTLSVRRDSYFESGGFLSKNHIIGDFDIVIRLSLLGKMGSFQKPLAYCRKHEFNESVVNSGMHLNELIYWYREYSKHPVVGCMKEFKEFYTLIMYKKYVDNVNNNSFSINLFKESLKNQTVTNVTKILIKLFISKINR